MLAYQIRSCEPRDLPALIDLCEKHAIYEQAVYAKHGKEAALKIALFSEKPLLFCWVVEAEGKLAGYASFTFDYSTWDAQHFLYLDCLYLEPEYRGQGIGEALMLRLQLLAREKGCVNMQWQTPSFNEGAIRFYERMGGLAKEKKRFSLSTAD